MKNSLENPATQCLGTDHRNIDPSLGILSGEGSHQRSTGELEHPTPEPQNDPHSYYGLPMLKAPVWKATIPFYFYVGGLAGASAALAGALQLRGSSQLIRKGRYIAFGGALLSGALLIEDLGIKKRFIYMMRVFRPTSPMNIGTWILSAFGGAATGSLVPGIVGDISAGLAALCGLPLAGYTSVLLSNTAVPLWAEGGTTLPPLFVASAAVSATSVFEALAESPRDLRVVRRLAVLAKLSELLTHFTFEKRISRVAQVARPLHEGVSGALWTAARVGVGASLALSLWPKAPRAARVAAGVLGTAGALATRFAIFEAGKASVRDPHASFEWQRA